MNATEKLSRLWISMEINNATKRCASERVSEKGWHPQCCCSNACFNGFISARQWSKMYPHMESFGL